ncbi:MAG: hypothetical protein A2X56_09960 [Nitrospirae bacterium GWC2_57_13]|jgi:TonB family protein|nr:MAG: hypothetical protein A2X56_09960 [Nitrospirae bacterium GWC2_57_13]OGW44995.1 MAG: hypothetical protein A2X57_02230 [Nitrospirae bacterium GWD2_57_8]HAR44965.1 hypothetical protein [Nitrospiraceae bacterium]HAS54467.1 hypothetical protein [Nitrospiraceae bacterium]
MNFPRSLYISFAIHALLFGSALAFAQYGEGLLGQGRDVITVTLTEKGGRGEAERSHAVSALNESVPPRAQAAEVHASDASIDVQKQEQKVINEDKDGNRDSSGSAYVHTELMGRPGLPEPEAQRMIREAIERAKRYPRFARERGIEGIVHVRFRISPSGSVDGVEVVKTSGHEILDEATVRTVYRAGPMPPVKGWIEVPVGYVLK